MSLDPNTEYHDFGLIWSQSPAVVSLTYVNCMFSECAGDDGLQCVCRLQARVAHCDAIDNAGKQVHALELFCGCGQLTTAINAFAGMRCWGKDIKCSPGHDIMREGEYKLICEAIDSNFLRYLHLAPPCNTFSMARYPKLRTPQPVLYVALG